MKKNLLFLICIFFWYLPVSAEHTTLLIKIVSSAQSTTLLKTLDSYYHNLSGTIPYHIAITFFNQASIAPALEQQLKKYPNLSWSSTSESSVAAAYNYDLDLHSFDILIASSDDVQATPHFDTAIITTMQASFPDFDGVLNGSGHTNEIPIIGRKFYERLGHVFSPAYTTELCKKELTLISRIVRKEQKCAPVLTPTNKPTVTTTDQSIFNQRQKKTFDLPQADIEIATPKLWSILICTLDERTEQFNKLYDKLMQQIRQCGLEDSIEILSFKDNRERSVGLKRNELLRASQGKYVCFIDDDDDIHDRYIRMIYPKLLKNPDCVRLVGIITYGGSNPKCFIHSVAYDHYEEIDQTFFRPPNHITPMRRAVAVQFSFPEKNFTEDLDWTMDLARAQLLHVEENIKDPYYFYNYIAYKQ